MSRQRIHPAAFAVACDGSVLANLHGYSGDTDLAVLLRRAVDDGRQVFIGTRLGADEARDLLGRLQDPCHEATGFILGARDRRRRKIATKSKRGGS